MLRFLLFFFAFGLLPFAAESMVNSKIHAIPAATNQSVKALQDKVTLFYTDVKNKNYLMSVAGDLKFLEIDQGLTIDKQIKDLLKLSGSSSKDLTHWLKERIKVIYVGNDMLRVSLEESIRVEYPDANVLPDAFLKMNNGNSSGASAETSAMNLNLLMSNQSAKYYFYGKIKNQLATIHLPSLGKIKLRSPRAGVVQVYESMFKQRVLGQSKETTNQIQRYYRIATLFHEARHGDGHGKSLGFLHATCPKGHELAGKNACDESVNGPYTVGAQLIKTFIAGNKPALSEGDKQTLLLLYLDMRGRVSTRTKAVWDDTSEKVKLIQ